MCFGDLDDWTDDLEVFSDGTLQYQETVTRIFPVVGLDERGPISLEKLREPDISLRSNSLLLDYGSRIISLLIESDYVVTLNRLVLPIDRHQVAHHKRWPFCKLETIAE
jgi:hypothetical protein